MLFMNEDNFFDGSNSSPNGFLRRVMVAVI